MEADVSEYQVTRMGSWWSRSVAKRVMYEEIQSVGRRINESWTTEPNGHLGVGRRQ